VPILFVTGVVLGIAGIVFAATGQTVIGLSLLAVGITDVVIALVLRGRGGS
jgi:hypothetical protein